MNRCLDTLLFLFISVFNFKDKILRQMLGEQRTPPIWWHRCAVLSTNFINILSFTFSMKCYLNEKFVWIFQIFVHLLFQVRDRRWCDIMILIRNVNRSWLLVCLKWWGRETLSQLYQRIFIISFNWNDTIFPSPTLFWIWYANGSIVKVVIMEHIWNMVTP